MPCHGVSVPPQSKMTALTAIARILRSPDPRAVSCRCPSVPIFAEATMPLFPGQQNESGGWEPQAADGRLAQTAGANPTGVFTSDLSVSEYVLLGEAG